MGPLKKIKTICKIFITCLYILSCFCLKGFNLPSHLSTVGGASGTSINQWTREESTVPIQRQNYEPDETSTTFSNVDDIQLVDEDEVEHLSILTGDRETPFNYLASLSAKWAAMKDQTPNVQGKIKVDIYYSL